MRATHPLSPKTRQLAADGPKSLRRAAPPPPPLSSNSNSSLSIRATLRSLPPRRRLSARLAHTMMRVTVLVLIRIRMLQSYLEISRRRYLNTGVGVKFLRILDREVRLLSLRCRVSCVALVLRLVDDTALEDGWTTVAKGGKRKEGR
jgi:hypothetical protein